MSEYSRSWAESVADFYHDLLSRVPPGLVIIGTSVCLWANVENHSLTRADIAMLSGFGWAPALLSVIVVGFVTYAIGVIVSGLGNFVGRVMSPRVWERTITDRTYNWIGETLTDLVGEENKRETPTWNDMRWLDRYIHLKVSSEKRTNQRLVERALAEVALLNNLVAAACISLVVVLVIGLGLNEWNMILVVMLVMLLVLSAMAAPYRFGSYLRTQLVLYRFSKCPEGESEST